MNTSLLLMDNAQVLDDLYQKYLDNPQSVPDDWRKLFIELDSNSAFETSYKAPSENVFFTDVDHSQMGDLGVQNLVNAYRKQGHLAANIDPLAIRKPSRELIEQRMSRVSKKDLETVFDSRVPNLGKAKLKNIIDWFDRTYCKTVGIEVTYLESNIERRWIQEKLESTANDYDLDVQTQLKLFEKLFQAESFEKFLAKKYVGKKRFSLEGGETLIPMLDTIVETAGEHKIHTIVIGMAHRGRLNVLENIMEKPASSIFAEFDENVDPDSIDFADVKYHLGYSSERMTFSGNEVHLSLAFNPSHLEAVNPVVLGSVRARQDRYSQGDCKKIMGLQIHGDASFMGQGVVAESLNLMNLKGYETGGTIHIVVNNQIGFTTLPEESRSTTYATDLAKAFQIPIFHINADDPEAAYRIVKLSMEYRQKFRKDVIIDLICYRRLGHNEMDEPAFTQPKMYDIIRKHPTTFKIYEEKLRNNPKINSEDLDSIIRNAKEGLENSFKEAKVNDVKMSVDTMRGAWSRYTSHSLNEEKVTTGQNKEKLSEDIEIVGRALTTLPDSFRPHPKLRKFIETRAKMLTGEIPIDWSMGEALAFGTILRNGHNIRLSGQDSQRGTFSQRHAVLNDIETNKKYIPLNHIQGLEKHLDAINSPLSEFSIMGFEYGYSLADPDTLVLWEGQFGDFVNGAQVIIDQFLSSSEYKWHRLSGLVLLLPHGYEGQGPEHSSARLERFLQLCAKDNMQVVNCSTPAQYFHLLRRQILCKFRKPLIVLTPKSLLRHPKAISERKDLENSNFHKVISDPLNQKNPERLVLCSGKVYYDILSERKEADLEQKVSIARLEQFYPFPKSELIELFDKYVHVNQVIWLQEEPRNKGAWYFIMERIRKIMKQPEKLEVVARVASSSPAGGLIHVHNREQKEIIQKALGLAEK